MRYDELPQGIQDLIQEAYERERRQDFDEIMHEVLDRFLREPNIEREWEDYREYCFMQEINSPDGQEHWWEWLSDKGIE